MAHGEVRPPCVPPKLDMSLVIYYRGLWEFEGCHCRFMHVNVIKIIQNLVHT